jgi:hypothetical protein
MPSCVLLTMKKSALEMLYGLLTSQASQARSSYTHSACHKAESPTTAAAESSSDNEAGVAQLCMHTRSTQVALLHNKWVHTACTRVQYCGRHTVSGHFKRRQWLALVQDDKGEGG